MLATNKENGLRFKGAPLHWKHGLWRLLGVIEGRKLSELRRGASAHLHYFFTDTLFMNNVIQEIFPRSAQEISKI